MSLKKYDDVSKKSSNTTNEDEFGIKDKSLVKGINENERNYNKFNEKGFAPEETKLENGDIIIAKVTPISDGDGKLFRDESQSYKSNAGGYVDKVWSGLQDGDGYNMIKMRIRSERTTMVGDKFCLIPDHEVLTNEGWMRFDDLFNKYHTDESFKSELTIAQLDENHNITYKTPLDVFEFDYNGKMYRLESQQVDFQVTPDHMLYVKRREQKIFELIKASDIYGRRYNLKKNGNFNAIKADIIRIEHNNQKYEYNMNAFLRLLGIFISDGYVDNKVITVKVNKERKMEYINTALCNHINYTMRIRDNRKKESKYKHEYVFRIMDPVINAYFEDLSAGALNKFLPDFVFTLDMSHANVLLEALIQGDGSRNNNGSECYYTSSKQLADDLQRLTLHAGKSSAIKVIRSIDNPPSGITLNADCLSVRINSNKNEPQINHGHINTQEGQTESWVDYDGKVYCLQVPSGVFLTRYNNKVHWTGNCSRHGKLYFA